ncbi:hypothetical protein GE061_020087 [Apolygus lucorum]|uniref:Counting factor associated protein D n=1 Tax=Apolygus lucorum TaxID=248454 RepID=A0A6A4JVZ3_APOLU|nr:hypothetical protein GE061_020087 [Apolygus lucorum]
MKMEVLVTLSALIILAFAQMAACDDAPRWPNAFIVSGVLNVPYAEVEEPFTAYFDGSLKSSRIDFYGGTVKTFQLGNYEPYGAQLKVVPVTTETEENVISCLQKNGTADSKVEPQSILPSLHGFQLQGNETMDGVTANKWFLKQIEGQKVSEYTMWISPDNAPIRYQMRGYNSLTGSHYDHYYLTYHSFDPVEAPSSVYEIYKNMTCTGFMGPGLQSAASFNPIKEFIHNYDEHIEDSWNEFKKKHKKDYKGEEEHQTRRVLFRDNFRLVESHNRAGLDYRLKLNHFADWTEDEMKVLRGKKHTAGSNNANAFPYSDEQILSLTEKLPDSLDWRLYGAVNPVKDQLTCGSCWSFASTSAIEGAYFMKYKELIRVSEQALMDCSWGEGNNACDGGEDFRSYRWIMKHNGIPLNEQYGGYTGQDGKCHLEGQELVAPITGYVNVTSNNENALRIALFNKGPISVAMDASLKTFSFYSNGVYSDPKCKSDPDDLDHAVLAIGYGTMYGKKYWLVQNSWSNMWGNNGVFLVQVENNICGIMTSPTYVTM